MSRHAWLLAPVLVLVLIGCDASRSPSSEPASAAAASIAAAADSTRSPRPTTTTTSSASPSPTATPSPTPSPTPTPWKTYKSKRFKYSMKYPPTWIVTPGSASRPDAYDDFRDYVLVNRDTVAGVVSITRTVSADTAWMKSHYKAKRLTNKPIRLAKGYSGRILTFNATDDGQKAYVQVIIVGKGRVGYFLRMWTDRGDAKADRALFKQFYKTWKPT